MTQLNNSLNCHEYYNKLVSNPTASENGLTYRIENNSKHLFSKWKIDNCILNLPIQNKCDYLLVNETTSECYWVELKSEDFDHACLQIHSSIVNIAETKEMTHFARIILNKFTLDANRLKTLRYLNHKKLINLIGGNNKIKYQNRLLTEKI